MIVTANIIPSKHPVWALRMLANLPVERDKFIPDEKMEEVKAAIRRYLQDFDYYQQLRRYFWNEHESCAMERVFLITSQDCNPILYVMLSKDKPQPGTCAICGCTEDNACVHAEVGPCWWIDRKKILCSHCAIDFSRKTFREQYIEGEDVQ